VSQARPLEVKQRADKGKVWQLFIGGALLIFGTTVAVENDETIFPAISRANRAMRNMYKRQQVPSDAVEVPAAEPGEAAEGEDDRLLAAVQAGVKEASAAASEKAGAGATAGLAGSDEPEASHNAKGGASQAAAEGSPEEIAGSRGTAEASSEGGDARPSLEALEAALEARARERQVAGGTEAPSEPSLEDLEAELAARLRPGHKEPGSGGGSPREGS